MNVTKADEILRTYGIEGIENLHTLEATTSGNVSYIAVTKSGEKYVIRTLIRQSAISAQTESLI